MQDNSEVGTFWTFVSLPSGWSRFPCPGDIRRRLFLFLWVGVSGRVVPGYLTSGLVFLGNPVRSSGVVIILGFLVFVFPALVLPIVGNVRFGFS